MSARFVKCATSRALVLCLPMVTAEERESMRLTGPVYLRRRVEQSEMRPNPCRAKIL